MIDLLKLRGATSGVINLGGNVACLGNKPDGSVWNVGLRAPVLRAQLASRIVHQRFRTREVGSDQRRLRAVLRVQRSRAPPHSGPPNRQTGGNGRAVRNRHSRQIARRDGYTTALIVMGAGEALAFAERTPGIEAILLTTTPACCKPPA